MPFHGEGRFPDIHSLSHPLKYEVHQIQLKTYCISVTKINHLILVKDIFTVYCENHVKDINAPCGQNEEFVSAKAGGTYSYCCTLKN
jgi:hypothetical protein